MFVYKKMTSNVTSRLSGVRLCTLYSFMRKSLVSLIHEGMFLLVGLDGGLQIEIFLVGVPQDDTIGQPGMPVS